MFLAVAHHATLMTPIKHDAGWIGLFLIATAVLLKMFGGKS